MKKANNIIILICILIVTSVFIIRYRSINKKFPATVVEEYNLNDEIQYRDLEVTVLESEMIEDSEIRALDVPIIKESFRDDEIKAIVVTLKVKNPSQNGNEDVKKLECDFFQAESINWSNGVELDLYQQLNKDTKGPALALAPGEEVTLKLPYLMFDFMYNKEEWENIKDTKFDLALDLYPVKKCVKLAIS